MICSVDPHFLHNPGDLFNKVIIKPFVPYEWAVDMYEFKNDCSKWYEALVGFCLDGLLETIYLEVSEYYVKQLIPALRLDANGACESLYNSVNDLFSCLGIFPKGMTAGVSYKPPRKTHDGIELKETLPVKAQFIDELNVLLRAFIGNGFQVDEKVLLLGRMQNVLKNCWHPKHRKK